MNIGAPQIIYLALLFLSIGISLAKYGQPKGKYDWVDVVLAPCIGVGLLYWGGFFG